VSYAPIGLGDQGEDMEAINRYIMTAPLRTSAATRLRDDWLRWYDQLSWYEREYEQATYDEARNRRNAFNLANATTTREKEAVEQVMKTGLTTEEMEGGTRRTTTEGKYITPDEPMVSTKTKIIWGAVLLGGAYAYFAFARPLLKTYRRARA
jgi:hypothetical protein